MWAAPFTGDPLLASKGCYNRGYGDYRPAVTRHFGDIGVRRLSPSLGCWVGDNTDMAKALPIPNISKAMGTLPLRRITASTYPKTKLSHYQNPETHKIKRATHF